MSRILLAVSGGIDSVYMACRAADLFPDSSFGVGHCNFALRGEESDGDEAFVREWCKARGLVFHCVRFDTEGYAASKGISVEMAARELRYGWFDQIKKDFGYDAVAVAHNANDNAETLILNLLRGTGIKGICGMRSHDGILRPLLDTSREQIREWMTEHGQTWREDRTNSESEYKRNRIRNEVFPIFSAINPSFVGTLNSDMRRFAQVSDIADEWFEQIRSTLVLKDGSIDAERLRKARHLDYVLWRLLEGSGIGQQDFSSLLRCIRNGSQLGGKTFGPVKAGAGRLFVGEQSVESGLQWEIVDRSEIQELRQPDGIIVMDASKVSLPLKTRRWHDGDWLRPLGMGGKKKKVSDLLVDLKWTPARKAAAQVLELEGSHVAALLCSRIDEAVKIDGTTEKVLRISYRSPRM